ncbi:hypothetical protein HMPREF9370_0016 [Neisseria wadsworthii 9715]|uniref:Uncharacterized protein n=1 Tax=Neisseria wadsworthii 9715 TaxID=1030841 RepID=G4CLQ7_9NEIS|nr:hypothetical protein HMPREF9370_0016 [Neisseria wadsworthii 9715]
MTRVSPKVTGTQDIRVKVKPEYGKRIVFKLMNYKWRMNEECLSENFSDRH